MDLVAWFACFVALAASGSAATALKQIASMKKEVATLKDELRRRGLVEHAPGEQTIIVPEGFHSK
ncbi:MAG: hypothetical protein ACLQIB_47315 [Isosphaeraceae bacterium]